MADKADNMAPGTLNVLKIALRWIIARKGWIPDQESLELMHKICPWPAVEVALVNDQGELLLHHRAFTEWPGKFGEVVGWYLPGGYMKPDGTMEEWCKKHLEKDGVLAEIKIIDTAGVIKWAEGEHPFGYPISILCICRLKGGISFRDVGGAWVEQVDNFRWTNKVVQTDVPNHTKLQEIFFYWLGRNQHFLNQ
jgi:ADP-ribose pyrophosphatase YjhB (NUDIX family)